MKNNTSIIEKELGQIWAERGSGRRFQNLMKVRYSNILLVSSLYDLYVFEEDGRLYELIRTEYKGLNLSHSPEITQVSSGKEAMKLLKKEKRFDIVITTQHIEEMSAFTFAKILRKSMPDIPIVLLAHDNREFNYLASGNESSIFNKVFIWTGDFRILIAILKCLEDAANVEDDTKEVGVQSIILIEDNVRFYSSYLPLLYTEVLRHAQKLLTEGLNLSHKYLRMRARPKILLCNNYEEAWQYFLKFQDNILGIISDINFPRNGKKDPLAGIKFVKNVRKKHEDIAILLQSSNADTEKKAHEINASFVLKDSASLLHEVSNFTINHLGFGDFIFRNSKGEEFGRASDLTELEKQIKVVSAESIEYHASRNHFSNWLKARTEFWLAHKLRPQKVVDFDSIEDMRQEIAASVRSYRKLIQKGIITDFDVDIFDTKSGFARIGGGSLGGKARGLSFFNSLLNNLQLRHRFAGAIVYIPASVVLGTELFDTFLDDNNLRDFALFSTDDEKIKQNFLNANKFPVEIISNLIDFLKLIDVPLAVRSSSLLEDSQYHPFAGVYSTYMLPNNQPDIKDRLTDLLNAIKSVYASTFYQSTKTYIKSTSYRLEEEKMAVIIQKLVGSTHGDRFYPDFSGVSKSFNYYPVPPQKSEHGIVSVALGLGKTVVEGGRTVKFSPKNPTHLPQFGSIKETLKNNQRHFYALDLSGQNDFVHPVENEQPYEKKHTIEVAEIDGTLSYVGSTYSHENNVIYDGISRVGPRLITFAPLLKQKIFALPEIQEVILDVGKWGMGTPIEIEFAVCMSVAPGKPKEVALLQMRPLVLKKETEELIINVTDKESLLCHSPSVLGHGKTDNIYNVVYVDYHKFDRSKSKQVAEEVHKFNQKLTSQNEPYLLIGVGRWGSMDPWLGIPVRWDHISGACTIVETSFKEFMVTPSQGSHFFQNLTSFGIGYFTVNSFKHEGFFDWDWLFEQKPTEEKEFTKHVKFDNPLVIKINGQKNEGIIQKPENKK